MNFITSPLEQFEVSSLIHIQAPILDYTTLSLTNLGLYTIITVSLFAALHVLADNNLYLVPSRYSVIIETINNTLHVLVRSQISVRHESYLPFLYGLFLFILIGNLQGNVPYGFTITSSMIVSLGISFMIFFGVTILSLSLNGLRFFTFFVPTGAPSALVPLLVPIEIVSYLARAVSLGVRLFANIVSGHSLRVILSGFLAPMFTGGLLLAIGAIVPFTLFLAIVGLELAVSFIQAYVFVILTASYIKDAIYLH